MGKGLVFAIAAGAIVFAGAQSGVAGNVNCGLVKKDLEMGRTVQDISERMMVSEEDVKKCQEEGGSAGSNVAPPGDPTKDAEGGAADAHEGHGH